MAPSKASSPSLDDVLSSLLSRRQAQGILRQLSTQPAEPSPDSNPYDPRPSPNRAPATASTPPPSPALPLPSPVIPATAPAPTTQPMPLVDFSSNDYLSISRSPAILAEYLSRLQKEISTSSNFALGSGGSRLLDGDSPLAARLEQDVASFHRAGAALLFNSGFEANTGLLACAPQAGDAIVLDELVHASAHQGARLSRAAGEKGRVVRFAHNAVWGERGERSGELGALDEVLRVLTGGEGGRAIREGRAHVFVAVEAVYSMDGDVASLLDVVRCVERRLPLGNGHVVVDEAHSNGLFGERGRGLVCQLGLEERVWARVNTFGKAMGCSGAVVLCSPVTRAYLINYARTFIYTTAMGSPALLSIQVAYDYLTSGRADPSRHRLQDLIRHLGARLARICSTYHSCLSRSTSTKAADAAKIIRIQPGSHQSPIIPIFTSRARSLAGHCQQRGYMVRAIVAPTVPRGTDRVRLCLHAGNTVDECDGLCDAIEEWVASQVWPTADIDMPTVTPTKTRTTPVAPKLLFDQEEIKPRL